MRHPHEQPIHCACCGQRRTWPDDFPVPHYAECASCRETRLAPQPSRWRRLCARLGIGLAALTFAAPAQGAGTCDAEADWPRPDAQVAAEVVRLVNEHRATLGRVALVDSHSLVKAAVWKAQHMARYSYLAHPDRPPPVDRDFQTRLRDCGYPTYGGENIGYGYSTPARIVTAWLHSPGHRSNIERSSFRAIGVGAVQSANGTFFWSQTFGSVIEQAPPQPGPLPTVCSNASVPSWFTQWRRWRMNGRVTLRPIAPRLIPQWAWNRLRAMQVARCPA